MQTQSPDTSPEAEALLIRLAREMLPRRKLEIAMSMTETVRQAALVGIRSRHPNASEDEVLKRLAALLLPREAALSIYGWDPIKEGY